jgi:glycosyltransferase involved in cell wall biosynthesis
MNVLMATAYFDTHRGGIEIVAGRLARELAGRGATVTWLATTATEPAADTACATLPIPAWNITERKLGIPLPLPSFGGIARIWRGVHRSDVVLLHDSLYPTNVVAMIAARWHRKPAIIVQHIAAVPYTNPLLRWLMQMANAVVTRPMLRAADQVVFISETVAKHFDTVRFKAPHRLIFNGVDTNVFRLPSGDFDRAAARRALGLPIDRPMALFVGRFVEKKGLHVIERLARSRPDVTFALAGWGPIDPAGWGLANVRVLSGLQGAQLAPLYQSSDVFLLPSIGEGLPLVMQEALACGRPVVCGLDTATADADLGSLVDGVEIAFADLDGTAARGSAALDRALAAAARPDANDGCRARHDFVHARYSWADAGATYLALMRDLVATRASGTLSAAKRSTQSAAPEKRALP